MFFVSFLLLPLLLLVVVLRPFISVKPPKHVFSFLRARAGSDVSFSNDHEDDDDDTDVDGDPHGDDDYDDDDDKDVVDTAVLALSGWMRYVFVSTRSSTF